MKDLIFALSDDLSLSVFSGLEEVRNNCEVIDIENRDWIFFNYKGDSIEAKFDGTEIIQKHFYGLFSSSSQNFYFIPTSNNSESNLKDSLVNVSMLNSNNIFKNITEIKNYLENIK